MQVKKLVMRIGLFSLFFFVLVSCSNKEKKCFNEDSFENYNGYGVVKFQKNFYGSIRYIEFYPICEDSIKNTNDLTKFNLAHCLIMTQTNSSKLWQSLIYNKTIKRDSLEFGFALIKIEYDYLPISKDEDHHLQVKNMIIRDKHMKVKTYDLFGELKVKTFNIIRGLE